VQVLITGGTGFVGSHTVRAVAHAGHDVRLLVRSAARVAPALDSLEVDPPPLVVGDATDPGTVREALDGCDAVIHCAAVFSYHPRHAADMATTNLRAAELVLRSALEEGCDPVVNCSSIVALLPVRTPTISPDTPVGDARGVYVRSKAEVEAFARGLQAEGGPVVSVLPGAVCGPHDPYVGETNENFIRRPLRGLLPFGVARASAQMLDVRELAAVFAACLTPGRGSRTYVVGRRITWNGAFEILRRLTGRRLPQFPTPAPVARAGGLAFSALARLGVPPLFTKDSVSVILEDWAQSDESALRDDLGVAEMPLETAFADTIRWMVEAGHLRPSQAGALIN
jgi:dihydroflavonol-4-reductase